MSDSASAPGLIDPREAARQASLRYVSDAKPGIARRRVGKGFSYVAPGGARLTDRSVIRRIQALAIPPAWTQVWICPHENGHIQATGRDQKGRKQYRYHPLWREVRDTAKYEHILKFAAILPAIRERVKADMARPGLPRERVLATVVHLLETTLIRVGNDDYAAKNESYGLTTLKREHVAVEGTQLRFAFKGKSGKTWQLRVTDRRVANIVRACQDLPGQEMFQYRDVDGSIRDVSSADVNDYLREISSAAITAKDFRTWSGTVLAATALQAGERPETQTAAKRQIRAAIVQVAGRLGNTPTICRQCYVHPAIIECFVDGSLHLDSSEDAIARLGQQAVGLRPEESAVLMLLHARLQGDVAVPVAATAPAKAAKAALKVALSA